ncbi:MAG: hypothetical protein FWC55_04825 [Firmicutes bacterium]|nr:hypothetical protein [Bacillota bacterium]
MKKKPLFTAILFFILLILVTLGKNAVAGATSPPGWFEYLYEGLMILIPLVGGIVVFRQISRSLKGK